jgi:hypothetical protein
VSHDKKDSAPLPFIDDGTRAGDQKRCLLPQHDHIAETARWRVPLAMCAISIEGVRNENAHAQN